MHCLLQGKAVLEGGDAVPLVPAAAFSRGGVGTKSSINSPLDVSILKAAGLYAYRGGSIVCDTSQI